MVYLPGHIAASAIVNKNKWHSRLSKDKMAEFLTKTEQKK